MRRREFIAALGDAAAWPLVAWAQRPTRQARIGVLAALPLPPVQRFTRKLQELGYIEGQNLHIDYRFAENRDDQYPILAKELVALPVDVCLGHSSEADGIARTLDTAAANSADKARYAVRNHRI